MLSAISATRNTISNYYIFKGVRKLRNYVSLCEENAMMGMQKKDWLDTKHFMEWMDHFIYKMEREGGLCQYIRFLVVLDGPWSQITHQP